MWFGLEINIFLLFLEDILLIQKSMGTVLANDTVCHTNCICKNGAIESNTFYNYLKNNTFNYNQLQYFV